MPLFSFSTIKASVNIIRCNLNIKPWTLECTCILFCFVFCKSREKCSFGCFNLFQAEFNFLFIPDLNDPIFWVYSCYVIRWCAMCLQHVASWWRSRGHWLWRLQGPGLEPGWLILSLLLKITGWADRKLIFHRVFIDFKQFYSWSITLFPAFKYLFLVKLIYWRNC